MPGSWEIHSNSVLVAVLHTDVTTFAWSKGLRDLIIPNGGVMGFAGMPYDMARNTACMRALDLGCSHVFFLDSDVIPPPDAILRMLRHNHPFISGLYCRRSPPAGVPVMIKGGSWVTEYQQGGVIEVDLVGAGCLLISRELLQHCPPQRPGAQWFDWRVNLQGLLPHDQCLSEDFTLCKHIKQKMGIPVLVDTSVVCQHVGYSEYEYGTSRPLRAG
jgi:hypothetical protein